MYCVHGAASVAGTWRSPRSTVGTNLLPAVDILRAVMSRNKMARRKTGGRPLRRFFPSFVPSSLFLLGRRFRPILRCRRRGRQETTEKRRRTSWEKTFARIYNLIDSSPLRSIHFWSPKALFLTRDEIAVFFSSRPDHFAAPADESRSSLPDWNDRSAAISFLFEFGTKVK